MKKFFYYFTLGIAVVLMAACETDNEHFCARYQYVYDQLLEDGLPSYGEMKQQLLADIDNPKKEQEQAKFMLFVLEDWYSGAKPEGEPSKDFCMRFSHWERYR